ncbi:lipoate--protein ligase family protein [Leptolyngbya sp. AN02str]|uniref:lipoate--protein ligase family protein n=1 Tax=Leptolyngbya sp. AN02str TaxID=3423363 RepID=UPI003D322024
MIPFWQGSGRSQMALDWWLFEQHRLGLHPPTLRFYAWEPVAISLGYHQRRFPKEWRSLVWRGQAVELVRRPSGGRAVLHQGDLTYAVVASQFADNRIQAYQQVCEFLVEGWRSLRIELEYGTAQRNYLHNPNCFGTATGADLVRADGTKLIGSAQLRQGRALLQHGSMRLNPDREFMQQVFGDNVDAIAPLPISFTQQEVQAALTAAAERCFEIRLEVRSLQLDEWQQVEALAADKSFLAIAPNP